MNAERSGAVRMNPETVKLKDGRSVLIRNLQPDDGDAVCRYMQELGDSTPFILTHRGDMPTPEHVRARLERVGAGEYYSLVAIDPASDAIVGNTSFGFGTRVKLAHTAGLGTGVLPGWQGVGLGSWMLDRAISDMRTNPKIHRLELTVMDGNDIAQRMYERAGFMIEGRKDRSIRQPDGSYADEILMGMWIGS
jgi:RimJ/RimL family protein N-acetyltransferase